MGLGVAEYMGTSMRPSGVGWLRLFTELLQFTEGS